MDIWWTAVVLLSFCPVTIGITDPFDVAALKNLFNSLKYPSPASEDPCDSGSGVVKCNGGKIIEIHFSGHPLNGDLGKNLNEFLSITTIDLKNNSISGSIPSNLPLTLQNLDLSDNHLDGVIPSSLGLLTELQTLSLSRNQLRGSIPDAFHLLTRLTDFYVSNNYLEGELPKSMMSLTALTTLHLQNNMFSGKLDVLQQLPLHDLNIENNLFRGPIPTPLFSIHILNYGGNPLSNSQMPSPPPPPPPTMTESPVRPPPLDGPPPELPPKQVDVPFDAGTHPPPGFISLASLSAPPPWSLPLVKGVSLPPKEFLMGAAVVLIILVLICVAFLVRRSDRK